MEKKIPGVFANKVNKTIGNNKNVFYSSKGERAEAPKDTRGDRSVLKTEKNINQKINDIFNSPSYIYKADVELTLTNGSKVSKRIVGKSGPHLITMTNELIPITDIVDIKQK